MKLTTTIKKALGFKIEKATRPFFDVDESEYVRYRGTDQPQITSSFSDWMDVYSVSSWVYTCVNAIAISIAQVPIKVWKRKPGAKREAWEEITNDDHPLVKLLTYPNPYMTQYEFKQGLASHLLLTGNAYIEIVGDDIPSELYLLLPHKVKIVPDQKNYVLGYTYELIRNTIRLTYDDVIHFKLSAPKNEYYGLSPLQAAELSIVTDLNSAVYNKNFFKNSAIPAGVLQTKDELSNDAFKRLKKEWQKLHRGVDRAHEIAILEMGLEWRPTTMTNKEMDFILSRKMNREEILAMFGVPPVMAGIMEHANYGSSFEQKRQFWEHTVIPKLMLLQERLNLDLVPRFGEDDLYAEFDTTVVQAMRENKESEARIASTYVDRGIKTINEIRREMGLPPVEWGDVWNAPGGYNPAGGQLPMELGPGSEVTPPTLQQPFKFPSQKGLITTDLDDDSETEGSEISPFRKTKLRQLLTQLGRNGRYGQTRF